MSYTNKQFQWDFDSLKRFYEKYVKTPLTGKVDKEEGKGLSTNDYDNTEKQKLADVVSAVGSGGSVDERITTAVAAETIRAQGIESSQQSRIASLESAVGTGGSVDSRIANAVNTETQRATTAEENLRTLYNNLQQSKPVPVTALPSSGTSGVIYRLAGGTSYADYMWDGSQFIKMAEYDNAVDNEPTAGSNNLVKSGGVANNAIFNVTAYLYGINDTTHTLTLQEAINAAYDAGLNNVARVISFRALEGSESVGKIAIFNSPARVSQFRDTAYWTVFDKSVIDIKTLLGYYTCSTSAGNAAKAVTAVGYTIPANGGAIKIKMTYANTAANATLNINGTGAKPLFYDGERASAANTWEAGEVISVYYDGTNYQATNVQGGGTFATGEKVQDIRLLDEIDKSNNIPKSSAIFPIAEKVETIEVKNTVNLLNKNGDDVSNFWCSGNVINQNSAARCITFEINGHTGDRFACLFLGDDIETLVSEGIQAGRLAFINKEPEVGDTFQVGSMNVNLLRSFWVLESDCKYCMLMILTKSTPMADIYFKRVLEGMVIQKLESGYPTKYVPYSILSISEDSLPDETREKINNIPSTAEDIGAVNSQQGAVNAGKVLTVNEQGLVVPEPPQGGGGETIEDAVTKKVNVTLHLANSILTENSVVLGAGWSGSIANGFTYASSGGSGNLEITNATTTGKKYLISIEATGTPENAFTVGLDEGSMVDPYNGTSLMRVGFISAGGHLIIKPGTVNTFSITSVKVQEIVSEESASESVLLRLLNVSAGNDSSNITGFWNVSIGASADTFGSNENGSRNISIGYCSLRNLKRGTRNICIGTFSMPWPEEADSNVAIGADTLYTAPADNNVVAKYNVAIGRSTLNAKGTLVQDNVAVGHAVMVSSPENTARNTCIGKGAGTYAALNNTYIGCQSGRYSKGTGNIGIGYQGYGSLYTTGDYNTCIGYRAGTSHPNATSTVPGIINHSIALGYDVVCDKSNQMKLGGDDITEVVIAGKLIKFNTDGTVTWESVS